MQDLKRQLLLSVEELCAAMHLDNAIIPKRYTAYQRLPNQQELSDSNESQSPCRRIPS